MNFFAAPPQSLAEEQKNLDNLKQYNPKLANSLLSKYMEMVVAAGAGEMETLQTLLLSAGRPPMTWFRVRMFQEAVLNCRLFVLKFMCDQGFEVLEDMEPLQTILLDLVDKNLATATTTPRDFETDKMFAQVAMFLVLKCKIDVDRVRTGKGGDCKTALHSAAGGGLTYMVLTLCKVKADVNCVAMDDSMPLGLAIKNGHNDVVKVLERAGAKSTWRRDVQQIVPTPWPVEEKGEVEVEKVTNKLCNIGMSERIEQNVNEAAENQGPTREADGGYNFSCE